MMQTFVQVINFRFDALTELGAFIRTEFLCVSVFRVAPGTQGVGVGKMAGSPLPIPGGLFYWRSKAVVPVLILLFVALWFILRNDLF